MAGLTNTEAARLLTDSLVTGGGRQLAIASTAPTSTATGTEFGTKQPVTYGTPALQGGVQTSSNTVAVTFTNLTAGTWGYINVYNGASERRWFGLLTAPKTAQAGDSLTFATASIAIGLQ